jgi:hypothetical protein
MAFRIISILVLGTLCALIARDAKRRFGTWASVKAVLWGAVRAAFTANAGPAPGWVPRTVVAARKTSYLVTIALASVLAVTGFLQVIVMGGPPSGTILLIHMIAAPLFALTLAAASLLWSHDQQIRESDLPVIGQVMRTGALAGRGEMAAIARVLYWKMLVLALPLLLSIILSLFPLFGTEGENCLISLHGYSALALVTVAILHGYICILQSLSGTQQG